MAAARTVDVRDVDTTGWTRRLITEPTVDSGGSIYAGSSYCGQVEWIDDRIAVRVPGIGLVVGFGPDADEAADFAGRALANLRPGATLHRDAVAPVTARQAQAVREQRAWIAEHGGSRAGYVARYGAATDPDRLGDGGEAIYSADVARLNDLQAAAGQTPR